MATSATDEAPPHIKEIVEFFTSSLKDVSEKNQGGFYIRVMQSFIDNFTNHSELNYEEELGKFEHWRRALFVFASRGNKVLSDELQNIFADSNFKVVTDEISKHIESHTRHVILKLCSDLVDVINSLRILTPMDRSFMTTLNLQKMVLNPDAKGGRRTKRHKRSGHKRSGHKRSGNKKKCMSRRR